MVHRLHECDRCARCRWSTHTSQGHLPVSRDHREDVPRWLLRPGLLAGLEGPAVAEDAPLCPGATGPVARLSNADLRSLNQYRPKRRTAGSAPRTLCPMAGTLIEVEVMSHAWVLVRPARDAAASWDPPAAPARFSMELPNIALVGEALRTEPTVDVIKLDHIGSALCGLRICGGRPTRGRCFRFSGALGSIGRTGTLSVDGVLQVRFRHGRA
jgi:hypothetical protein